LQILDSLLRRLAVQPRISWRGASCGSFACSTRAGSRKISRLCHRQITAERVLWSRSAAGRAIVSKDAMVDIVTKTAYFALAAGVVLFIGMFLLTLTHS
jgi:hypothetical protein